jgi:hypothetical protein
VGPDGSRAGDRGEGTHVLPLEDLAPGKGAAPRAHAHTRGATTPAPDTTAGGFFLIYCNEINDSHLYPAVLQRFMRSQREPGRWGIDLKVVSAPPGIPI